MGEYKNENSEFLNSFIKKIMEQPIEKSSDIVEILYIYADLTENFENAFKWLEQLEEFYPHEVDQKLKLKSKYLGLDYEGRILQLELRKKNYPQELCAKILKTPVSKSAKFWLNQLVSSDFEDVIVK